MMASFQNKDHLAERTYSNHLSTNPGVLSQQLSAAALTR